MDIKEDKVKELIILLIQNKINGKTIEEGIVNIIKENLNNNFDREYVEEFCKNLFLAGIILSSKNINIEKHEITTNKD